MPNMMRYSVEPKDQIFKKNYGFLSSAKNMGKNFGKDINRILSGKYSQKRLDHAKKSVTDALKTDPRKVVQKKQKQQLI